MSTEIDLRQGDALEFLALLGRKSVDAFVTDPPYFAGDTRDQRSFRYWCDLWMRLCLRAAKPGAALCVFTDWRQLPTTTDALQSAGWVWRGVAVWDKCGTSRPQKGRFRAQAEYVVWGTAGPRPLAGPVIPGVFRSATPRNRVHQTQKPVEVLEQLVQIAPPRGLVVDPFLGGGTTAVACARQGRRFLGCELVPEIYRAAKRRLKQELEHERA